MLVRIFSVFALSCALWAQAPPSSTIRFEDATAASGINFTHSFGAEKLGSLLEGTGGGCVWFDYNSDGLPDLYVTSGKPLEVGMHPYPLKQQPESPPHNHLYRNDGNGKFTDVTEQAGLRPEQAEPRWRPRRRRTTRMRPCVNSRGARKIVISHLDAARPGIHLRAFASRRQRIHPRVRPSPTDLPPRK